MPAQWTAEVVGKMHLYKITAVQLAKKIGWHPKYLSAVLNGKRDPKHGERIVTGALEEMIPKLGGQEGCRKTTLTHKDQ